MGVICSVVGALDDKALCLVLASIKQKFWVGNLLNVKFFFSRSDGFMSSPQRFMIILAMIWRFFYHELFKKFAFIGCSRCTTHLYRKHFFRFHVLVTPNLNTQLVYCFATYLKFMSKISAHKQLTGYRKRKRKNIRKRR